MGWIKNPKKAAYHKGFYGCEEITIGFANKGLANEIVDFMAMDSKGIIRWIEKLKDKEHQKNALIFLPLHN